MQRRQCLWAGLGLIGSAPGRAAAADAGAAEALLRGGGVVVAFRHARAPGTFDPPQFRLGDCSTQRNLDDAGRAQARRIGQWFEARGLVPQQVRSSPWCRCLDTATLAFGRAEPWAALGSPHGSPERSSAQHLQQLQAALQARARQRGDFEVWVTHMFVLAALVQQGSDPGEGLVLGATDAGPRLLARIPAL